MAKAGKASFGPYHVRRVLTRQVMRDDDCPIGMFPVVTLRSSRTKRSGQVANGNCSEDKHSRASLTSSARETYEAKATPGKDDRGV